MKIKRFLVALFIAAPIIGFLIGKMTNSAENPQHENSNPQVDVFGEDTGEHVCEHIEGEHIEGEHIDSPLRWNLTNIHELDNTFFVDLKYATTDNFTGIVLYDGIDGAYFQPDVGRMLAEAHRYLKTLRPDLRLLIYDAARPLSAQRTMWERVKDTKYHRYVASPDRLSLHNFGAAVDLTLSDTLGRQLDMGTPFDHFGRAAGINDEDGLMSQGLLNKQQIQNRRLLRQVMRYAGFRTVSGEWWHFNACTLQEAKERYALIED